MLKPIIRLVQKRPYKSEIIEEFMHVLYNGVGIPYTPKPYSILFCYLQPKYLSGIHTLLSKCFWPGIDGITKHKTNYSHTKSNTSRTHNSSTL